MSILKSAFILFLIAIFTVPVSAGPRHHHGHNHSKYTVHKHKHSHNGYRHKHKHAHHKRKKRQACGKGKKITMKKFLRCVTVEGVREHQAAFQEIADNNNGVRTSGTPGYDESVDYVAERMRDAGYDVVVQPFDFESFQQLGPSEFTQLLPDFVTYVEDEDYTLLSSTDPGNVAGPLVPVDLDLGPDNNSTSGCEAEDFDGFLQGDIALLQRGACSFRQKAENAAAAGATGVIIFNQGNTDDRKGLINATLSADYTGGIPVFFATYDLGEELASGRGVVVNMVADVFRGTTTSFNVIAESRYGDNNEVIMAGAHLDSVDEGPGIQDNGSGSAAILEVAEQMRKLKTKKRVRFAWWGAEESGLIGSTHYVSSLREEELAQIEMYLNFDMIGSPNYVRFIYDGDGSSFGLEGPEGSADIEAFFENFYIDRDLAFEPTQISFRSDYAEFFNVGIPFGGLFTGAEGIKTDEQAIIYGGTAGEQYDPCYHLACDTFDNISLEVLDLNSDAVAASVYHFAEAKSPKKYGKHHRKYRKLRHYWYKRYGKSRGGSSSGGGADLAVSDAGLSSVAAKAALKTLSAAKNSENLGNHKIK